MALLLAGHVALTAALVALTASGLEIAAQGYVALGFHRNGADVLERGIERGVAAGCALGAVVVLVALLTTVRRKPWPASLSATVLTGMGKYAGWMAAVAVLATIGLRGWPAKALLAISVAMIGANLLGRVRRDGWRRWLVALVSAGGTAAAVPAVNRLLYGPGLVAALGDVTVIAALLCLGGLSVVSHLWLLRTVEAPTLRPRPSAVAMVVAFAVLGGLWAFAKTVSPAHGVAAGAEDALQNVVLIGIESLRSDDTDIGPYRRAQRSQTPNLARMAKRGVTYDQAFAQAPWTLPAMASVLTGRYPPEHGATRLDGYLGKEQVTLAESLRERGYRTAAIVGNFFVGTQSGFRQGFADFDDSRAQATAGNESIDDEISQLAMDWLDGYGGDSPFFLFVFFFDPHHEYLDHPDWTFADGYDGWLRRRSTPIKWVRALRQNLGAEDVQFLRDLYDEEIASTDRAMGRLLRAMESRSLFERSVVTIFSDHGEEMMERGWIGHGTSLEREQLHVPLVVVRPDEERRGSRVSAVVETRAIYRTVLDAAGVTRADDGDSPSLPAVTQEGGFAISEVANDSTRSFDSGLAAVATAIRSDSHTLIVDRLRGKKSFYDRVADPLERSPRDDGADGAVRSALADALDAWRRGQDVRRPPERDYSRSETELLRALGYVQ